MYVSRSKKHISNKVGPKVFGGEESNGIIFYKQPRPVSTLLKGLIRWLVHIHYNPKAIAKTEYSTLILNKREPVLRCMTAN